MLLLLFKTNNRKFFELQFKLPHAHVSLLLHMGGRVFLECQNRHMLLKY